MKDRRQFLATCGLVTASFALICTSVKKSKPSVLLVLTDDQGWGDIQSHGNNVLKTPVLDRLAASGARFERFYVSPVCAPTRASLLTGRYHLRTNVTGVTRGLENMRANGARYNGDMRGYKGSPHEGGSRVPCFISWPGKIKSGTTIKHISAHIDILPTLVELAGIQSPVTLPLDGKSLKPLLDGSAMDWPERQLYTHWANSGAVRSPQYRAVKKGDQWELYDMLADPGETTDLSGEKPELLAKYKADFEAWYKDVTGSGIEKIAIPVGYREMPVVTLSAHECTLNGSVLYKGGQGWANDWVTGWRDTESSISWDIDVVRGSGYNVTVLYTCPAKDVGSRIRVEAGPAFVEGVLKKAHNPPPVFSPDRVPRKEVYEKQWAQLDLGTIQLDKGAKQLTIRALSKPGETVFDVKAIRLSAVDI
ncbi:sulfatase-like hydrolase/transferase [candidate division KSB1 bacterium]|nr:sulfatase-like hydrolase/transferase [candidate division KSB1 bacterium]